MGKRVGSIRFGDCILRSFEVVCMNIYVTLAAVLFCYMTAWFIISYLKKRNDVADIAWGLGFPMLSWTAFALSHFSLRAIVINILITIWGIRLASHIYARNKNKPEDARYAAWRKEWKYVYLRSFFQIFMLQGIFLYLIVLPSVFANSASETRFGVVEGIGLAIWAVGFFFESVGDKQLANFIKEPANKGKIMQSGLWKYTRHPNYFGEVTMWWGIFVMTLSLHGAIVTIVGPLTITILILFVSGVPLLEKRYQGNAEYEAYKKRTSVFLPLPPKKA